LTTPAVSVKFILSMNILDRKALSGKKALPVVNVVPGVLLAGMLLFFVRDILSLSLTSTERAGAPELKPRVLERRALQDYAGILKNNPFGFPGRDLRPLAAAPGQSVSRTDILWRFSACPAPSWGNITSCR
jgi:hypothetical protein